MLKRFHDAHIWKQRWFIKLKPDDKTAFSYLKDNCHHSGIWEVDCLRLMEETGIENFDLQRTVDAINTEYDKITGAKIYKERLRILPNNLVWITGHIQFQFESKETGHVNPKSGPVKTALQHLNKLGLFQEAIEMQFVKISGEIPVFGPVNYTPPPPEQNEGGGRVAGPSEEGGGRVAPPSPEIAPPSLENEGGSLKNKGGSHHPPGRVKDKDKDEDKDKPFVFPKDRGAGGREQTGMGPPGRAPALEKKFLIPEMLEIYQRELPDYPGDLELDSTPLLNIATFICLQGNSEGTAADNREIVKKDWTLMAKVIAHDKFYFQKSLSTIAKQVQEIYQMREHGQHNGYGGRQPNGAKVRSIGKGMVHQKP